MSYVAPQFTLKLFTCPHCNALSHMVWKPHGDPHRPGRPLLYSSECTCEKHCHWLPTKTSPNGAHIEGILLYPHISNTPGPHPDMPDDIAVDFEEARSIFSYSPRSSAALLRLCLEKLCTHLVGESGSINEQIKKLVLKGLPVYVQQALDATRIVGNNAVHIIELDVAKNPDLAGALFGLINFIVESQISHPAQVKKFYEQMPQGARDAVEKRDK